MEMNRYMLEVMDDLRSDTYFYKSNTILRYLIPKEGQVLTSKIHSGLYLAVMDLAKLGAITIHNKGEEKIPGTTIFEFEILVIQPSFDGLYARCIKENTGKSLVDYENQIDTLKNRPVLLKKLDEFVLLNHFGPKEKLFLSELEVFRPILIQDFERSALTSDVRSLKKAVQKKLTQSDFSIKTIRAKSMSTGGAYQLVYNPPAINSNF